MRQRLRKVLAESAGQAMGPSKVLAESAVHADGEVEGLGLPRHGPGHGHGHKRGAMPRAGGGHGHGHGRPMLSPMPSVSAALGWTWPGTKGGHGAVLAAA